MQMGNTGEGNQRRTILPALTSLTSVYTYNLLYTLYTNTEYIVQLNILLYTLYTYRIHCTINKLTLYLVYPLYTYRIHTL